MKQDMSILEDIYKLTAFITALSAVGLLLSGKPWIALSIVFGALLMTAILFAFQWMSQRSFTPTSKRPKLALWAFLAVKYPLLGVLLYGIVNWGSLSIPAFCGGVLLVHVAIVIRVLADSRLERVLAQRSTALINQNSGGES